MIPPPRHPAATRQPIIAVVGKDDAFPGHSIELIRAGPSRQGVMALRTVEGHAQAQIALFDAGIGVEAVSAKEEKIGSGV